METKGEYSIVPVAQRELTPQIWRMLSDMSPVMFKSRLFGVGSPEAAAAIMLKGYELGLSVTASFEFVQVVEGKPSLSPRGALALLHKSPAIKNIDIQRLTDSTGKFTGYSCTIERSNGFAHTSTYTLDDAQRAGLVKPNSGWAKYPENMCLWRAIGFCVDVVAPDISSGMTSIMKMPEEFGIALSKEGDVIDSTVVEAKPVEVDISPLIAQYGAERVMQVLGEQFGGQMPGNEEQYEMLRATLDIAIISFDDIVDKFGVEAILKANNNSIPKTDADMARIACILSGSGS